MHRHPHPDGAVLSPGLGLESALGIPRRPDRVRSAHEHGVEGVAHRLDDVAVMLDDRGPHQGIMTSEGDAHRLGLVLPARGAAFDVREQERHCSAWQRDHVFLGADLEGGRLTPGHDSGANRRGTAASRSDILVSQTTVSETIPLLR